MQINKTPYGKGDSTYLALGGFEGIKQLVDNFYAIMDREKVFTTISTMNSESAELKRDKLTHFLCAWTGGKENYAERNMWLGCMEKVLGKNNHPEELQIYFLRALSQPAEVIRHISEQQHGKPL